MERERITVRVGDEGDREAIYRIRHDVYARELGQHSVNASARLTDPLDEVNTYLVAKVGSAVVGFVSVTPPNSRGVSVDKYFRRDELPFVFDDGLYEVRLLTVVQPRRGSQIALLLMYGAFRYIESLGGRTIVAIGRLEVLEMYRRAGLVPLGRRVKSGQVVYELMSAEVSELGKRVHSFLHTLSRLEESVDWQLARTAYWKEPACYHGGAFFEAIGEDFETLDKRHEVINADVLDAWFEPAPSVTAKLLEHLTFAIRTSPPATCEGMRAAIARARGVPRENVLPGAGSSDLIFAGLRTWVTPKSRVLILDPMYGEYAHVLEHVIGARVERLKLSAGNGYSVDVDGLRSALRRGYDWVMMVNPNSPTGRHSSRANLESVLSRAPAHVCGWTRPTSSTSSAAASRSNHLRPLL